MDSHHLTNKHLSTILEIDKELNLFGLANLSLMDVQSQQYQKRDTKPLFPQTAIVQVCCGTGCCKHRVSYSYHYYDALLYPTPRHRPLHRSYVYTVTARSK